MSVAGQLLVIGDREPLAWVLTEQRMAFPQHRTREASALVPGDLLLIYTTRGCFHNPTRDRGRVIGEAIVASSVRPLPEPIVFGVREFPIGCRLSIRGLAPRSQGVELAPLVTRLEAFPDAATWSARMRRAIVPLQDADIALLREALAPHLVSRRSALRSYLTAQPTGAV